MEKIISLFIITFFITFYSNAQSKFITKSGRITFEASQPSFEEVKANNDKVTAIIDTATGEIAALALVKGFRFKIALMEEHFNENYAESDKYPKAKFTGKIIDYTNENSNKTRSVLIEGSLTFHGVTKKIEIPAELTYTDKNIQISSTFKIKSSDFKVEIPFVVRKKVAEEIEVKLNFILNAK